MAVRAKGTAFERVFSRRRRDPTWQSRDEKPIPNIPRLIAHWPHAIHASVVDGES